MIPLLGGAVVLAVQTLNVVGLGTAAGIGFAYGKRAGEFVDKRVQAFGDLVHRSLAGHVVGIEVRGITKRGSLYRYEIPPMRRLASRRTPPGSSPSARRGRSNDRDRPATHAQPR